MVGKTNCSRLPAVKPAAWFPWSPLEYRFAHGEESHLRVMRDILGEIRLPIQQRNFGGRKCWKASFGGVSQLELGVPHFSTSTPRPPNIPIYDKIKGDLSLDGVEVLKWGVSQ